MNKSVLVILSVLITTILLGQDLKFSTEWGKELKASKKSSLNDIIGYDATGIYVVKEKVGGLLAGGYSMTLEHFDKSFSPTASFDLDIKEEGYECKVEYFLQLKGKIYMFYSYAHQKDKKNVLLMTEINKKTLQPDGAKKKLGEIDYSGKSKRNSGYFNIRTSRDSSKVMVEYGLPYDEDEPEQFGFNVLDDKLNSLWQKKITLPYKDELFDVASTRIDNQGNVYVLGLVYKEKRKSKRKGKPNYNYEVIAYRDKGNSVQQYPVILEDRFITDMQIEILDNKNLICAGFYSEKDTYSIKGTYFLTIDAATKAIKTKSFKEFGIDFITENMTEREANKTKRKDKKGDEAELFEYDLDKLLVGKDGSAILIGEQYFVNAVTTTMMINGTMTTRTTYHYYYNDIIAVKINPKGQIEWAEKVAKTQHSIDDGGFYSSYAMAILNGKISFIFNDNPKNLGKTDVEVGRPANVKAKESLVVIVSLDQNGKETKQPVFSPADVDVIVRPKVCEQISNHEVILFGQRKKEQQFARITFQ